MLAEGRHDAAKAKREAAGSSGQAHAWAWQLDSLHVRLAGEPWLVREVVKRLRRKLGDNADKPKYILSESSGGGA